MSLLQHIIALFFHWKDAACPLHVIFLLLLTFYLAFVSLMPIKAVGGGTGEVELEGSANNLYWEINYTGEMAICIGRWWAVPGRWDHFLWCFISVIYILTPSMAFCWRCCYKVPQHIPEPHWNQGFASTSALSHSVSCKPGQTQLLEPLAEPRAWDAY